MLSFVEDAVSREYLEVLPSRWSALLPRVARQTQMLQKDPLGASSDKELDEGFALLSQLLDREHAIYRDGILKMKGEDNEAIRHHTSMLLQGMLSDIAVKEVLLSDWRESVDTIAPDKLRVYCHAMIAPKALGQSDVQRLVFLLSRKL